jgi:hypothetical protein
MSSSWVTLFHYTIIKCHMFQKEEESMICEWYLDCESKNKLIKI